MPPKRVIIPTLFSECPAWATRPAEIELNSAILREARNSKINTGQSRHISDAVDHIQCKSMHTCVSGSRVQRVSARYFSFCWACDRICRGHVRVEIRWSDEGVGELAISTSASRPLWMNLCRISSRRLAGDLGAVAVYIILDNFRLLFTCFLSSGQLP